MKKFLSVVAAVTLLFSTAAFADIERGYTTSNASANKELSPDTVDISIAVVTFDNKSMQKATAQNKEISGKIYTALKAMINPKDGDYVKTSDFSAQPIYNYNNNKRVFNKYEVSNRVIVHTKSIEQAGAMIDKAMEIGATNIDSLNFSLSSYEKQCDELLATASKKTRTRADLMAASVGTMVTGVKSLSGSCNSSGNNQRVTYRLMAKSNMALGSSMEDSAPMAAEIPIETGAIKIYANVNANYFVK